MNIGIKSGKDTQLSSTNKTGYTISAVALSDSKVFIAYSFDDSYYLYGMICTIDNTTIEINTSYILGTFTEKSGLYISATKMSNSQVFIAHIHDDYQLYGIICNIYGTSITAGNYISLGVTIGSVSTISAVALSDNKVFIAYKSEDFARLYGIIYKDGKAVTNTQLSNVQGSGSTISTVALSENKVFIAHSSTGSNDKQLYGLVCTVSDTSITTGTDTRIRSANNTGLTISTVKMSNTKVFIAHSWNTERYLSCSICNINGTSIGIGTFLQLSTTRESGYSISAVALSENKVFITHRHTDYKVYGIVCMLNGSIIEAEKDIQLSLANNSGSTISTIAISESKVFTAHSYNNNYQLYGMINQIEKITGVIKLQEATEKILGIAKTEGSAGNTIEIYTPNIEGV